MDATVKEECECAGHWNNFPASLRMDKITAISVLVVDDDPLCLKVVEQMLRKCSYEVHTCTNATTALGLLREKGAEYDLVLSDVYMPDMDGFKLLEVVGLEMDLPVIMMSSNGDTSNVLRGVTHGACDYLIKPVRLEELRNLWQHVVRRRRQHAMDLDSDEQSQERDDDPCRNKRKMEAAGLTPDQFRATGSTVLNEGPNSALALAGAGSIGHGGLVCVDELGMCADGGANKKARVVWSVEMHQQFVNAVNTLGIDKAVPKKILEIMNVDGLTRENVASHLQKYRLYLKRVSGVQPGGQQRGGSVKPSQLPQQFSPPPPQLPLSSGAGGAAAGAAPLAHAGITPQPNAPGAAGPAPSSTPQHGGSTAAAAAGSSGPGGLQQPGHIVTPQLHETGAPAGLGSGPGAAIGSGPAMGSGPGGGGATGSGPGPAGLSAVTAVANAMAGGAFPGAPHPATMMGAANPTGMMAGLNPLLTAMGGLGVGALGPLNGLPLSPLGLLPGLPGAPGPPGMGPLGPMGLPGLAGLPPMPGGLPLNHMANGLQQLAAANLMQGMAGMGPLPALAMNGLMGPMSGVMPGHQQHFPQVAQQQAALAGLQQQAATDTHMTHAHKALQQQQLPLRQPPMQQHTPSSACQDMSLSVSQSHAGGHEHQQQHLALVSHPAPGGMNGVGARSLHTNQHHSGAAGGIPDLPAELLGGLMMDDGFVTGAGPMAAAHGTAPQLDPAMLLDGDDNSDMAAVFSDMYNSGALGVGGVGAFAAGLHSEGTASGPGLLAGVTADGGCLLSGTDDDFFNFLKFS